jgi:hypothetical protein
VVVVVVVVVVVAAVAAAAAMMMMMMMYTVHTHFFKGSQHGNPECAIQTSLTCGISRILWLPTVT